MNIDRYSQILNEITYGDCVAAAILTVGEMLEPKCTVVPSGTMSSDDDTITIISNDTPMVLDKIEWIESNIKINGEYIKLYPYQRDILEGKYRIVAGGRQIGLTTTILCDAIYNASTSKCNILIQAPNHSMLDRIATCIRDMTDGTISYLSNNHTIKTADSCISLKTDNERYSIHEYNYIYVDGADMMTKIGSTTAKLPPSMYTIMGSSIMTDDRTHFKEYFEACGKSSIRIPMYRCPTIDDDTIDYLYRCSSSMIFRHEVLARWE